MSPSLVNYLLKTADDSFIIGHRNSEWTGLGPFLEEDIAFASMAQDKIGHAWAIYKIINENGFPNSAEWLAFQRPLIDFRCAHFVQFETTDYGEALIRHFLFDHAAIVRHQMLLNSSFEPIAHYSKKIKGELKYHTMHADTFVIQLGNANEESNLRLQQALNNCMPLAYGLFDSYLGQDELELNNVIPKELDIKEEWLNNISKIILDANLKMPTVAIGQPKAGGRDGVHLSDFVDLISEMREVINLDPSAEW
jgi:ring-1,2-phenylacetyl-CoA epoxidase subunit PaaC